jgi:hypothetical protein
MMKILALAALLGVGLAAFGYADDASVPQDVSATPTTTSGTHHHHRHHTDSGAPSSVSPSAAESPIAN